MPASAETRVTKRIVGEGVAVETLVVVGAFEVDGEVNARRENAVGAREDETGGRYDDAFQQRIGEVAEPSGLADGRVEADGRLQRWLGPAETVGRTVGWIQEPGLLLGDGQPDHPGDEVLGWLPLSRLNVDESLLLSSVVPACCAPSQLDIAISRSILILATAND